jgi:hypothetical protein
MLAGKYRQNLEGRTAVRRSTRDKFRSSPADVAGGPARRHRVPIRAGLLALAVLLAGGMAADAGELTLKRVMLSSGGVGYFEYEAAVDGDASLTVDIPIDQVDDVLKSLVVFDSSGSAGEITLPGREPLAQSFTDLPFDRAALASATALLNALQGAEIHVNGDKPLNGRLVGATDETVHSADGGSATQTRIGVMTDAGLRQVTVKDLDTVEFADPALAAKIKTALTRIAAYRAEGRRQLTIASHGSGKRTVRIGYVVGMPLWKATYRLSLSADPAAGIARLQGWAVMENFSGQAWNGVELTLLSGNPVTFRQALYESYYVPRPTVPVESGNRVLPPPPDSGVMRDEAMKATENTAAPPGAPASAAKAQLRALGGNMGTSTPATLAFPSAAPPPPPPAQIEAAAAAENATQIAFTVPYKVSVAAGQSLVVPLIDRDLPARRLDIYQPAAAPRHPLAAIELTNAGETGLPPGVLTLYEQSGRGVEYLGDARLATLPAGDKRLLDYAADDKVTVVRNTGDREAIVKAAITGGVMHLTRLQRRTTTYEISAATAPPALVIEQPRLAGWTLAAPDKAERTAGAYRVPAALDAKGSGTVAIVEEQPVEEQFQLADIGDDQLGVYLAAKELDPKLRAALAGLAQRRQAAGKQQAELDRLGAEREHLADDETRLRDNYTALKDDPAMRKSTLDKLKAAEAAIDANTTAAAKASSALDAAKADLAAYIAGLKL